MLFSSSVTDEGFEIPAGAFSSAKAMFDESLKLKRPPPKLPRNAIVPIAINAEAKAINKICRADI
jgi:hypothetical protein